jgi:hypothetical protein
VNNAPVDVVWDLMGAYALARDQALSVLLTATLSY